MPSACTPELLALQRVVAGRYSIECELARGGMGIVFLARDVALERHVAIKLLPLAVAGDERMRDRFVREARTAARLSHPNIVPIHSVEEHDDIVFFEMGFVDGETLTARVRRVGPLDPREAGTLIQELAWALAYAHTAGVIHRDVKPDNVMIDRASGRAMLTDFGIARVGDSGSHAGEVVGTAQFVSPEQASGAAVDGRSDLYSLGVTAFFALTGRFPFESETAVGLLMMHATQPAPPVASIRASLPARLCTAVDRCLAKDPADRFATGEQLAEAIADAKAADVQVSPAVRAFLRDRTRTTDEVALLYIAGLYLGGLSHLPLPTVAVPLGGLALASVARLFQTARRLIRAGYSFEDVRTALRDDVVKRREELSIGHLTDADEARIRGKMVRRAAGFVAVIMGGLAVLSSLSRGRTTPLLLGAAAVVAGAALMRSARGLPPRGERVGLVGHWLDQLWQGRFGRWFFALATPRGERSQRMRPRVDDAPTEVLLARSAAEVLDALPLAARRQVDAGHDVIERLRDQIASLREREAQLAAAIAEAGEPRDATFVAGDLQPLIERRAALANELEQARRDVSARRASAVAALENIRLQLLRLHAGIGSPADLTADLEAAMDIERRLDAVAASITE